MPPSPLVILLRQFARLERRSSSFGRRWSHAFAISRAFRSSMAWTLLRAKQSLLGNVLSQRLLVLETTPELEDFCDGVIFVEVRSLPLIAAERYGVAPSLLGPEIVPGVSYTRAYHHLFENRASNSECLGPPSSYCNVFSRMTRRPSGRLRWRCTSLH